MSITMRKNHTQISDSILQLKSQMTLGAYQKHQSQLDDIINKCSEGLFSITFCGHFSAGKSSLINQLCGHTLLPSSPIPTSANVVTIRNDAAQAKVKKWGDLQPQSIALELLQDACKQGEEIESVEINYPIAWMGADTVLLDTPGVDSTDEAHMKSTLSAIHLSDVVFYVMDYNHVMSEINFAFTKRLQEWNKPIFLIVNQIDKHEPEEIDFNDYRAGVKKAFEDWHIDLEAIFFITLKEKHHPYNELEQLDWYLKQLISLGPVLRDESVKKSVKHIVDDHIASVEEAYDEFKAPYVKQIDEDQTEHIGKLVHDLKGKITALELKSTSFVDLHRKDIIKLLDNANIIPAQTRELAHLFLESTSPKFKVGLLFSKNKTEQEKRARLTAFSDQFKQNVQVHILHHLQNLLKSIIQQEGLRDEQILSQINQFNIELTEHWLTQQINQGAVLSNEYTMTYSAQISNEIKAAYRRLAFEILDKIASPVIEKCQVETEHVNNAIKGLSSQLTAHNKIEKLNQQQLAYQSKLISLLDWELESVQLPNKQEAPALKPSPMYFESEEKTSLKHDESEELNEALSNLVDASTPMMDHRIHERVTQAAERIDQLISIVDSYPSMDSSIRSLKEKSERLKHRNFTIALFGAFSAGKSSFANALIGEKIVPVSPNPTTSAINKVMRPETPEQHGTAKITMKSLQTIVSDVQYSLELLGHTWKQASPEAAMDQALNLIRKLLPEQISGKGKAHYAFLKAVEQGWEAAKDDLGQEMQVDMEDFKRYVAEEVRSCFVMDIELYYSCPVTEQGIVLVDTPGADSINARHTGVAFNYIKNSDAILFVTYYNHAFSQADREFLEQLGRVKNSFELDKMFFIINAADLADSAAELDDVAAHVRSNLQQFQIQNAKIYPLSSKMAVDAKLSRDANKLRKSGMPAFEQDFIKFSVHDLVQMSVDSIEKDIARIRNKVQLWLDQASQDVSARQNQIIKLKEVSGQCLELLNKRSKLIDDSKLEGEIKELFYYVKQRYVYRFNELFQMAFNPATLREEQGDRKTRLRQAWAELRQLVNIQLSQEALALSLRIESFLRQELHINLEQLQSEVDCRLANFELNLDFKLALPSPAVEEEIDLDAADEKLLLAHYKNSKQFFEENGKEKLREQLNKQFEMPVDHFIDQHYISFNTFYNIQTEQWLEAWLQEQRAALEEHIQGMIDAQDPSVSPAALTRLLNEIDKIINQE
jgi:small GTP-binding protein